MPTSLLNSTGQIDYAAVEREVEDHVRPYLNRGVEYVAHRRQMAFSVVEECAKQEAKRFRMTPAEREIDQLETRLRELQYAPHDSFTLDEITATRIKLDAVRRASQVGQATRRAFDLIDGGLNAEQALSRAYAEQVAA